MIRALLIAALVASPAMAQEPPALDGIVGCVLTWNYPVDQEPLVQSFPIWIDGQHRLGAKPDARSVTCDEIGMSSPGTYRLELFARAKPDSGYANSPRVAFLVTLAAQQRVMTTPDEIRLTYP